jgi:hypothetical protein
VIGTIDVMIAGIHYEGRLRPVGVYPLGFNLACLDISPNNASDRAVTFPMEVEKIQGTEVVYGDEQPLTLADLGLPLIDKHGRIVAVLVGKSGETIGLTEKNMSAAITGAGLEEFLNAAAEVPRSGRRLFLKAIK